MTANTWLTSVARSGLGTNTRNHISDIVCGIFCNIWTVFSVRLVLRAWTGIGLTSSLVTTSQRLWCPIFHEENFMRSHRCPTVHSIHTFYLIFLPLDILLEYWIEHVSFGLLYVMFTFPTRIFYRGVPSFTTDCPCDVWCRGLTTCPLYVGPLFGNLV